MSNQGLGKVADNLVRAGATGARPISRTLIQSGAVAPASMLSALAQAAEHGTPLERILVADGLATPDQVLRAQARHWGVTCLSPDTSPPDPELVGLLDPAFCLRHGVLAWSRTGTTMVIATARPDAFQALRPRLSVMLGPVVMALALESDIQALIIERHSRTLGK